MKTTTTTTTRKSFGNCTGCDVRTYLGDQLCVRCLREISAEDADDLNRFIVAETITSVS